MKKTTARQISVKFHNMRKIVRGYFTKLHSRISNVYMQIKKLNLRERFSDDRGDVPGWVLVVLMTTGLVTAIWAIAAPRLSEILKHSLDSMNSIG